MTIDPRVDIGHVHLKVSDLDRSLAFYCDVLGFELKQRLGDQAAFVSAGGYHHHLGFNVWMGRGVQPSPEGTAGLRHWTVVLDTPGQVDAVRARAQAAGAPVEDRETGFLVRDPWGIGVAFEAAPAVPAT